MNINITRVDCSRAAVFAFAVLASTTGCVEGGSNLNQKRPGGEAGGVALAQGDIAVSSDGAYFVSRDGDALALGDMTACSLRRSVNVTAPGQLGFAHKSHRVFVTSLDASQLVAIDADRGVVLWRLPVELDVSFDAARRTFADARIFLDPDDANLILVSRMGVEVIDPNAGKSRYRRASASPIVDVALFDHGARLAVVEDDLRQGPQGSPLTFIDRIDLVDGHMSRFSVPNCASVLTVAPDQRHAFLAPTQCGRDPVSLLDLGAGRFVSNLPGFGPVAVSPDGRSAVAFMDTRNLDLALLPAGTQPPDPAVRYYLMLIDTMTWGFRTVPIGDRLPRYAMTPDGNVLIVDQSDGFTPDKPIRLLDVATGVLKNVAGPAVDLSDYVITRDSRWLYAVSRGLYALSIGDARIAAVPLPFVPSNLNISPDDHYLLLRDAAQAALYRYDLMQQALGCKLAAP
jgi:hypothetical protein